MAPLVQLWIRPCWQYLHQKLSSQPLSCYYIQNHVGFRVISVQINVQALIQQDQNHYLYYFIGLAILIQFLLSQISMSIQTSSVWLNMFSTIEYNYQFSFYTFIIRKAMWAEFQFAMHYPHRAICQCMHILAYQQVFFEKLRR